MAAADVGGAFLQVIFDRLASKAVIDYFSRKKLDLNILEKLKISMLSINKVIDDAEQKETIDRSVKQWLDALKEAVYDAEDLLDAISTLDHTHKMKTKFHRLTSKLRSSWNPFEVPINQELDNVFGKLQLLVQQKDALGLKESHRPNSELVTSTRVQNTSLSIEESCVYGRDIEKESLKKLLLSDDKSNEQGVIAINFKNGLKESNPSSSRSETRLPTTSVVEESGVYERDVDKECIKKLLLSNDGSNRDVIAIVGVGGLGKTTLAEFVFNDDNINRAFKLNKVWICVAEDFDVIKITETILEELTSESCHTNDFDHLQMKLKEVVSGKRFLIALDDVWNENYSNWENLRKPFDSVASGSKIIVTTRSERVASVMRATSTYKLKPLSDEACWLLFAKHAFENIQSDAFSTFEALGRELVKKCRGLPLAAKVLGGLLRTKLGCEEWNEILTSDIWDISDEASDNILPVLRLSYHYLPSHLKRCFAFCSIVPKDFEFEREKLILLWMVENLLQDAKSKKKIDVGYEYLRDLESRSLIQPASSHEESCFSMHDLVNDLAKSVSEEFFKSFDREDSFNVGHKTRHFSSVVTRDDDTYFYLTRFKGVSEAKRLRTFLPLSRQWNLLLPRVLHSKILPRLNVLRSLTLAHTDMIKLPYSIGDLKLLRYLDLSYNEKLIQLPESVACLYNLEVLNLWFCSSLTKLPSKMKQLSKLNILNIGFTRSLKQMPLQMGSLKVLDVLTDFVVGKGSGSSIAELKELKNLRGHLFIHGLQNIIHPEDASEANLKEKSNLEKLSLGWDVNYDNSEDERIVLENLRPHVNLEKLYIGSYSGTRFPDWLGDNSFVNLVDIVLWGFKHCFDLSPLGKLPSLRTLLIRLCSSLVTLVEFPNEIHHHVGHFSALVNLHISYCRKLELPQHHCFTSIDHFTIDVASCASLQFFPLSIFPKLKTLCLAYRSSLESLAVIGEANNITLEYLETIKIQNCSKFEYFNGGKWCAPNITYLELHECESLKILPENMCNLLPSLASLSLYQCANLEALPQSGLPSSLRNLKIIGCNKLIANRSSWSLQRLLSLSTFEIGAFECDDLQYSFPEEGLLPSSLLELWIGNVPNLRSLNRNSIQLLTFLDTLELNNCPKLQCLPELPTSLSTLYISNCPLLESRCQREQGEDWSKIALISNIHVYR